MSTEDSKRKSVVSRRGFLQGTLATGLVGAAAASGVAQKAPVASDRKNWEVSPEPIPDGAIKETIERDIVAIGAGISGLAIAHAAAEGGATVAVVEKGKTLSARGWDNGAIGTKVQKRHGIKIDRVEVANLLMQAYGYKAHHQLVKLWCDRSGEVFDYYIDMAEAEGMTVDLNSDVPKSTRPGPYYAMYRTSHNFGMQNGFYIVDKNGEFFEAQLLKMIERKAKEHGANFYYKNQVEQLIRDSATGRVTGVIAKRQDHSYVKYVAKKAVVLCTGDYGGNKDMVNAWCSFASYTDGCMYTPMGQNTGDGHKMGLWVGASLQKAPHCAVMHPVTGGPLSFLPFLYVNKRGERYANEDMTFPALCNARILQPGNIAWSIYDADYREYAEKMPNNGGIATPLLYPGLEDDIAKAISSKMGHTANTIEELALALNIPVKKFSATVKRYNDLVAKGADEDFGKRVANLTPIAKAPFYAMKCSAPLVVTVGGLNVSPQMEVLDGKDEPIPGLYAIGNVAGNFFGNDYTSICLGISHGRCLTFGRLLGQAIAKGQLIEM